MVLSQETTFIALEPGEMIINDLPVGSVLIFAFNLFTSFFFQFLGFVITYFLSTTHDRRGFATLHDGHRTEFANRLC